MILDIQKILPNLNHHTYVYTHVIFVLFLKSNSDQLTVTLMLNWTIFLQLMGLLMILNFLPAASGMANQ